MVSSIIWLYLVQLDKITDKDWFIYLPIVTVEIIAYLVSLPKVCDFIDDLMNNKVEGQ